MDAILSDRTIRGLSSTGILVLADRDIASPQLMSGGTRNLRILPLMMTQ